MHRRSLPPARTIALFARTLYRQLGQAGYHRVELLALVNEIIDLMLVGAEEAPLSGISDAETSLSNVDAVVDALAFEMRRAHDIASPLLVLVLEIVPPDWCTDEQAWALHARVAQTLRGGVRPGDIVGRISTTRYALVMPGALPTAASEIISRLVHPIFVPPNKDERPPQGTTLSARVLADDGSFDSAAALLARCASEPAVEIPPASTTVRRRTMPPRTSLQEGFVLALGGGAARAAAHVGVLRTLEERDIAIAGIAGTSAGALVGAMYLCGMKPDAMLERFDAFTRSDLYRKMRRSYVAYSRTAGVSRSSAKIYRHTGVALLSNTQLAAVDETLLTAFVEFFVGPDRDISSLSAPFAAAVTDLVAGRPVWIRSGPLHLALRASCALPGLFPPLIDGGRILVDGAVLAEVPVAAARQLCDGARVLAVHLARPDRPETVFSSSVELVTRANAMAHKELVRQQLRDAALLLTAHVGEIGWLDFRRAANTAAIGADATSAFLDACMKTAEESSG